MHAQVYFWKYARSNKFMIQLNDFINNIPDNPGVYFFKDISNKIIYIGKAKNLNKRVRSYFYKNNHAIKNKILVSKIIFSQNAL